MRYKVIPRPRDEEFLRDVRRAVPLVPGSVEDCCSRIRDATAVSSRDAAREYLTFLEALSLVEETPRGYRRLQEDPADVDLESRFEAGVFPARELLAVLDEDAASTPEAAFERLRSEVPRWERDRHTDWEREWQTRVEYLLEWAVVFGLASKAEDGYRLAVDR